MKNERTDKILSIIQEKESVDIKTLMETFFVSEATIRRDLKILEDEKLIIRSNGKAISTLYQTISFKSRKNTKRTEKHYIAKNAVKDLVSDGMFVMLDASSTAMETVFFLKEYKGLKVLTSGIETLFSLAQTDLDYYSTGGEAYKKSLSLIGKSAIDMIKNMNADICFVSCHGLSSKGYATDNSIFENDVRRTILEQSKRKVLLLDSSKIGKECINNLCHISYFDDVYSDKPLGIELENQVKNFHLVNVVDY